MIKKLQTYYDKRLVFKRYHPELPIIIWNYTPEVQYDGLWDDITIQTRGLVTDESGNVLARPFKKFWNLGEKRHTPTEQFEVFDKLDGSLIILFWYEDQWIVASRGSFESDQAIAAKRIVDGLNTDILSKEYTYLFEYISKWNKIVVDYGDVEKLVLLSAIHTETDVEVDYWTLKNVIGDTIGVETVTRFDGITDYITLKDRIEKGKEGFVIRFENGQRVKIKSDEYLELHRIVTGLSTTAIWECLKSGRGLNEILKIAPDEYYKRIDEYANDLEYQFYKISDEVQMLYSHFIHHNPDASQKDFALWVAEQKSIYRPILFMLKQKRTDYKEYIWKLLKPDYAKL